MLFEEKVRLINKGLDLEKFVTDEHCEVRLLVAKQGAFKEILHKDKHYKVRKEIARQGHYLNELKSDSDWRVRKEVALKGVFLDLFIEDENPPVRAAVAQQGYGLEKLVNDRNPVVRVEVLNQLLSDENVDLSKSWMIQKLLKDEFSYVKEEFAARSNGYGLDVLCKDKDESVRIAVARTGKYLEELVHDKHWGVRLEVARADKTGKYFKQLVEDEDWAVRLEVSRKDFGLETLHKDEHWLVRLEIANQGLFLDVLKYDENFAVKEAAEKLIDSKVYIVERKFGTYHGNLILTIKDGKYKIESGCYITKSLDEWHEKCEEQLGLETADKYYKIMKDIIETAN